MAIIKSQAHLQSAPVKEKQPMLFAPVLVQELAKKAQEEGPRAMAADDVPVRHSWAGKCARQVYYNIRNEEPTNPMDLPGTWAVSLGKFIHEAWQAALERAFPTAQLERIVVLPNSAGHADASVEVDGKLYAIELKTINGYGFRLMAESGQRPRYTDELQLFLNALAMRADEAVLIYLSLEAISKPKAAKAGLDELERICKEFHYGPEEFAPKAKAEMRRLKDIAHLAEGGQFPARVIPDPELPPDAEIVNPDKGFWQTAEGKTGYYWGCGYCAHQERCVRDG